jgi:hypothetical protein
MPQVKPRGHHSGPGILPGAFLNHNHSASAPNPNGIAYPSPGQSRNAGIPWVKRPNESQLQRSCACG